MGIDPGTNFTGYGIITVQGKEVHCEAIGYIDMVKMPDTYQKLRHVFERVSGIIESYRPDQVAFESPFYGENVQSMLKLGRAQGVAMAAALTRGLPVFEYAPRKVKASITGNGAASKEQVAAFLCSQLKIQQLPTNLDSTDGLAVAMCHYYEMTSLKTERQGKEGIKSWKDFAAKNRKRIKQ
ncbi:MAG: crossover junction endodeoxyribonuclease RuvC [Rikenellaceae bacterium]|nr:crossover junction endodeoxyribonuclease RuvC [Rikenellaceae bacterium]